MANTSQERTGSAPDLRTLQQDPDTDYVDSCRCKRKTTEDDLHMLFEKFSSDLSIKLCTMKTELESKLSDVQTDINGIIKSDLESIKTKLSSIDVSQDQLFIDMESVKSAIEYQDNIQKDVSKRVQEISNTSSIYSSDITRMQEVINNLQYELNEQQQRDRAFNLELTGVPERSNENLNSYFCKIVQHFEVPSSAAVIVHMTRVRQMNPVPGRPKSIVIKLNSRLLRDTILAAARAKKGLQTSDIGIFGEPKKIFINEHLTPTNKRLHKNTRDKAKIAQYRYVWVRDGKIFTRKNETSPTIRITSENDLRKLV